MSLLCISVEIMAFKGDLMQLSDFTSNFVIFLLGGVTPNCQGLQISFDFCFFLQITFSNRSIIDDNAFVHFQELSVYTFPHICMTLKGRKLFPKMITKSHG